MSDNSNKLLHHHTVFDGWRSISIALYMTLVGYGVLVGIPVISTAWVTLLGFSEVEVGRVAGADLGGLIERLIQTIQTQLEVEIRAGDILTLEQLNRCLSAWLAVSYHKTIHSETK